ncbi:MAG: pilus assembly protein [Hyphomonadaceae bacterium]|nr:pilus assembly protein [Hyphomonadaceae bacterium]MCA8886668.1 pilus assembly protein [Hyphomonadaceae bacterium]
MKLIHNLRRFARETKGLAALEFAIIAPLLMVPLLLGSVDLIDVMGANKRAQNAASSLADVVARDTEISNSEITSLWRALDVLMYPNEAGSMEIRVSSISIVNASTARVVWSEGHGGMTARTANSTVTLDSRMMNPGTSIIMVESVYKYDAPLGFLFQNQVRMTHDAYRRSRLVDPIPRVA